MIIRLIVGLIKKTVLISEYFSKPKSLKLNVKVKFDLSNYATKADLKSAKGVDTSRFAKNINLASFKPKLDKLDVF